MFVAYYDSAEVKTAVEAEIGFTAEMMLQYDTRHRMAEQQAVCFVCEAELYPFSSDPNHHVATVNYERDGYHHYCSAHCPTCNSENDDTHDEEE